MNKSVKSLDGEKLDRMNIYVYVYKKECCR